MTQREKIFKALALLQGWFQFPADAYTKPVWYKLYGSGVSPALSDNVVFDPEHKWEHLMPAYVAAATYLREKRVAMSFDFVPYEPEFAIVEESFKHGQHALVNGSECCEVYKALEEFCFKWADYVKLNLETATNSEFSGIEIRENNAYSIQRRGPFRTGSANGTKIIFPK